MIYGTDNNHPRTIAGAENDGGKVWVVLKWQKKKKQKHKHERIIRVVAPFSLPPTPVSVHEKLHSLVGVTAAGATTVTRSPVCATTAVTVMNGLFWFLSFCRGTVDRSRPPSPPPPTCTRPQPPGKRDTLAEITFRVYRLPGQYRVSARVSPRETGVRAALLSPNTANTAVRRRRPEYKTTIYLTTAAARVTGNVYTTWCTTYCATT